MEDTPVNETHKTWDEIFDFQRKKDGANYTLLKNWLVKFYEVPRLKFRSGKPKMDLRMRISIDSAHTQRHTEDEVLGEIQNDNVKIEKTLIIRKSDGAVLGQILINV